MALVMVIASMTKISIFKNWFCSELIYIRNIKKAIYTGTGLNIANILKLNKIYYHKEHITFYFLAMFIFDKMNRGYCNDGKSKCTEMASA